MMNLDAARVSDPVVGMADTGMGLLDPKKPKKHKEREDVSDAAGVTEPVFQAEEKDLNIEIPQRWKVAER